MYGENISKGSSMVDSAITVRILVVDDDSTCLAIVAAMLKVFNYQVATAKSPLEALSTLRMNHELFDLVLTDVHMPIMSGLELQKQVEVEFRIPVILMSADDKKSLVLKGLENGASFFIVKPPTANDLKNLWQYVVSRKKGNKRIISVERARNCNGIVGNMTSLVGDKQVQPISCINQEQQCPNNQKRKLCEEDDDQEEKTEDKVVSANPNPKKSKLIWTTALHNKFLEAIRVIGFNRAVPKKILEYMNIPGLTRENIASHLQKYRIYLRRVCEASGTMQQGMHQSWTHDRPFRTSLTWGQFPTLTNNMPLINSPYVGSQGLNLLNTQPNTFVQPKNPIGPNPIFDPSYLTTGQMHILESSMVNDQNNNNDGNNQDDLATAAMQFLAPKPNSNFDQFEMNINVGPHIMVTNHGQEKTTMVNTGGKSGESSGYQGGLFDMITNNGAMALPHEGNQGFSFCNNGGLENNFNGGIKQGVTLNDQIVENEFVEQAINVPNLDNISSQQVIVENNANNSFSRQNNSQQEMPNFDTTSGSSPLLDWTSSKNPDEMHLDGIDELTAFLQSFDSQNGSNYKLR